MNEIVALNAFSQDALINPRFTREAQRDLLTDSEQALLGEVFRKGAVTQADLTSSLPLSQQSVSRMVSALESRGMVTRGARRSEGRRGQPSSEIGIDASFAVSAGVSLRADSMSCTLVDFAGRTLGLIDPPLPDLSQDSILNVTQRSVSQLMADAQIDADRLFGLGIAITGFRVGPGAIFNPPPSLEAFALIDLETLFANALNMPVWAENDGKAATLAELLNGVGTRCSNFAYFYIATGVGGGIVMNGRPVKGARGNAGEFVGALPIPDYTFPNLEVLRTYLGEDGLEFKSVAAMAEAYDDDWPAVERWIKTVEPSLSLMVSATSAILDTDEIVLGGLMPRALAERVIPRLTFFDINRRTVRRERANVVPAECVGDATATGAALLPLARNSLDCPVSDDQRNARPNHRARAPAKLGQYPLKSSVKPASLELSARRKPWGSVHTNRKTSTRLPSLRSVRFKQSGECIGQWRSWRAYSLRRLNRATQKLIGQTYKIIDFSCTPSHDRTGKCKSASKAPDWPQTLP